MSKIAKWKQYSEEEFRQMAADSRSIRELATKLGYAPDGGGTAKSLKEALAFYDIDTSHFLGQSWNKDNFDYSSFDYHTKKKNGKASRKPLIALRGQKCECCGITEWMGKPINLEIHHINGDRGDNRLENLQLLCPNCHSYTETFCNKQDVTKRNIPDEDFVKALLMNTNIRAALKSLGLSACGGNYERAYNLIEQYNIIHLKKEHQDQETT